MATQIRRVQYFYASVKDRPGEAYHFLEQLAGLGINLLAFTAVPVGPSNTQLTIFPDDPQNLITLARKAGVDLEGPHHAFLVQGNDEIGALAEIHKIIFHTGANVFASTGVSSGKDSYGYILYLRPEDFEKAANALEV